MPTYAITGGLGSGKTLVSVGRIKDYLEQGRRVATNLNLDLEKLLLPKDKNTLIRMQDFPKIEDLNCIGRGHYVETSKGIYSKNEKLNGLIVLDECAVLFNSREWGDKTRAPVIAWLRHSRKLGWDVIYIMQDVNSVDKQLRAGLIEHEGVCKRADRFSLPLIGGFLRFLGLGFLSRPPRIHLCTIKYGLGQNAPVVDRWVYRGTIIQEGYDTNQIFHDFDIESDSMAIHSNLSPWMSKGRYLPPHPFKLLLMRLAGTPYRKPPTTRKHPLTQRLMRLPVHQRLEFFRRFEKCGSFA
jgi:hypothetical protein